MTRQAKNQAGEIEGLEAATVRAIISGQRQKVMRLYDRVERLFTTGDRYTRSLIANKFIFPLSQLLEIHHSWGRAYLRRFPAQLRAEYRRQIYSSGT